MNAAVPAHQDSLWVRFWHEPVRAERLACMRIFVAVALLTDQLFQYLPFLSELFGPDSLAPGGLHANEQMRQWRWTYWFFGTDNMAFIHSAFWLWVAVTVLLIVGWRTRWMTVAVWFLTRCFIERNPNLRTGADDTLQAALFWLALSPSGKALSLDAWRLRRRGQLSGPAWVPPWSLRLIQLQVCLIYATTGLVKLKGEHFMEGSWADWLHDSSWWNGTSVHYLLNYTNLSRWAYAQFPVPLWITAVLTYSSVSWEVLFPVLMLQRWTRRAALIFGILFHLGICLSVDVGWFGFYTLCFYPVWIPDRFWSRFDKPSAVPET